MPSQSLPTAHRRGGTIKQLSLVRKGMILLALPLAVQVIAVGVLMYCLAAGHSIYNSEAHRADAAATAAVFPMAMLRCADVYIFVNTEDHKSHMGEILAGLKTLQELGDKIDKLAGDDPAIAPQARTIQKSIAEMTAEFHANTAEMNRPGRQVGAVDRKGILDRMSVTMTNLHVAAQEIATSASTSNESASREEAKLAGIATGAVVVGLALNSLLALMAASFLMTNVSNRLNVISDNTRRIAANKPLLAAIAGSDELAALDGSFHKLARALAAAADEKRHFLEIASAHMRSPLLHLRHSMAKIASGQFGNINETGKERLSGADQTVQRLLAMLGEMIDGASMDKGSIKLNKSRCNLAAIVASALAAVQEQASAGSISLIAPSATELDIAMQADSEKLVRVLTNLLANAIKFSPAGQTVTIACRAAEERLEITVTDKGRGIPAEMQTKIFERFTQVDKADSARQAGAGLGLAISREIVEAHRGTLTVESSEGRGSTFRVKLPLQ